MAEASQGPLKEFSHRILAMYKNYLVIEGNLEMVVH